MSFRPSPSTRAQLRALTPGRHLCLFYDRLDEQLGITVEYIQGGLERGERCFYASDQSTLVELREALAARSIDVDRELTRGGLVLVAKEEVYLRGGRFDAEGMIAMLADAVQSALDNGFTGLRAAGDMTWLIDEAPGSDEAIVYEAMMNEFYPSTRALGLCLYDRRRLHPLALEAALRTHPAVLIGDQCCGVNPFYEAPEVFFQRIDARERFNWKLKQVRDLTSPPNA